ncbi:hypothetical protein [Streptomyces sp. CBMA152]|uniref:hypothetical protein n=1 Tax=Streptomyces sp. CBMA152 TaxID=1896312 RepID=UPI001660ABE4|nr:hypothetical protein [Streptomyces sp. CBMA152]
MCPSATPETSGRGMTSADRQAAEAERLDRQRLESLIDELRARQQHLPGLAEQRHQFLDIDPDLAERSYPTPAG